MAEALAIAIQSAFCQREKYLSPMDGRPQVVSPCASITLTSQSRSSYMARALDLVVSSRGQMTGSQEVSDELSSNQSKLHTADGVRVGNLEIPTRLSEPEAVDAGQEISKLGKANPDETVAASIESRNVSAIRNIAEEDRFVLHLVILSLYKDQIKPQRIEIKHRLQELQCSPFLEQHFVEFYEALDEWYCVERTLDNNVTVYLKETPNWFSGWVDMRDIQNPYPLHVWIGFDSYVVEMLRSSNRFVIPDGLGLQPLESRGGRYGLSKKLKLAGPAVFRRYSLGQVCHIVQLAVHLGLLAYDGGSLMPAAGCRSLVRRLFPPVGLECGEPQPESPPSPQVAESSGLSTGKSCTGAARKVALRDKSVPEDQDAGSSLSPVVIDLDEVHRTLALLLDSDDVSKPMLLSQLKFRFLNKFKKRLDPVCFGFTRLSDFLAEKCQKSCRLVREGGRQVLVDRVAPRDGTPTSAEGDMESGKGVSCDSASDAMKAALSAQNRPVKGADWGTPNDADIDRTTRGLLAIVAKHNRFHCNLTFSFWQFCAETRRLEEAGAPLSDQANFGTARNSASLEDADVEDIQFCPAGRFTDFLFASVLRPAAVDVHHVSDLQQPSSLPDGSHSWSESPAQRENTEERLLQPDGSFGHPTAEVHSSIDFLTADSLTSMSSPVAVLGEKGSSGPQTQRSGGLRQCQLHWFTRRPLVERQLGGSNPLSEEDVEALQHVFFSVLPPRLPLVSLVDASRVPRPSKLRRQISSQIAQLRREIFCPGSATGTDHRGLPVLGAAASTIGPL